MSMLEALGGAQQGRGRNTLGRAPIYRIMLNGEPLDVNVQEVSINLSENMHDTVLLTVSSAELTTTLGILEGAISFLYGHASKTEVFSGYVTELQEVQNDTGVLTWTMGIMGPTKTMQTGMPRYLTQRTIPSAVEYLSYSSYLGYTGHPHTHVWPALAQTDGSDWKVICSWAKRLGWSIYNRYGIVMMHDPLQLLLTNGVAAVLVSETYNLAKDGLDDERSLLEFNPEEESETATKQQGTKVAYFNQDQLQVAFQQGDHAKYRFVSDFVIRNAAEAKVYVDSDDSDDSNWRQSASARCLGNANLFPGMSVEVLTTNPKYYTGKFNGRWLIRAVQHKMDKQSFQTNLMLSRPDDKIQVYTGAYAPFWQLMGKSRPVLSLSHPMDPVVDTGSGLKPTHPIVIPTSTSVGVWVSSWSNSTVRSVA